MTLTLYDVIFDAQNLRKKMHSFLFYYLFENHSFFEQQIRFFVWLKQQPGCLESLFSDVQIMKLGEKY